MSNGAFHTFAGPNPEATLRRFLLFFLALFLTVLLLSAGTTLQSSQPLLNFWLLGVASVLLGVTSAHALSE